MRSVTGIRIVPKDYKRYEQHVIFCKVHGGWRVEYFCPSLPQYKYCPRCGSIFGSDLFHREPYDCGRDFRIVSDAEKDRMFENLEFGWEVDDVDVDK